MAKALLDDDLWALIEPLLPPAKRRRNKYPGRKPLDDRAALTVLREIVAVRLHVDGCSSNDGPLKVVPGSHIHGRTGHDTALALRDTLGEVVCPVGQGGASLMSPLLLHSSSKATGQSRRRVLHFLFAPRSLPFGLR